MSEKRIEIGIEPARAQLGPLINAVIHDGTDVVITRHRKPIARIIRYREETAMLATVATAGTITDRDRIGVDETRDGAVVATPFVRDLVPGEIDLGFDEWDQILTAAGWHATSPWIGHDGYWTCNVERTLDLADLTRFLGAPDHDQEAVFSWSGETDRTKRWTQEEADELAEIWQADTERIASETA
jgi:prevent-host-death family protein